MVEGMPFLVDSQPQLWQKFSQELKSYSNPYKLTEFSLKLITKKKIVIQLKHNYIITRVINNIYTLKAS